MTDANLEKLIEYFKEKGAKDPESWARDEAQGEESSKAAYEILSQLFYKFSKENSVDKYLAGAEKFKNSRHYHKDSRIIKHAAILEKILAAGVEKDVLSELLQLQSHNAYFRFATIIDGMMGIMGRRNDTRWLLFEIDEDEKPVRPVALLHDRLNDESFMKDE